MSTGSPIPTTDSLPNYIGTPEQYTLIEKVKIVLAKPTYEERIKEAKKYYNNIDLKIVIEVLQSLDEVHSQNKLNKV